MAALSRQDKVEMYRKFGEKLATYPWGVDADIHFHVKESRIVIVTDIGNITYYMTTFKLQVRSHLFTLGGPDEIYLFLDQLFTEGTYLITPNWSSKKVDQDPEFLAKVTHPFIKRKKS